MDVKTLTFESAPEYKHLENAPVVFFCAEYALDEDSSMYAGGLGVLAGDFILESADENLPFVAVGLWYGGPRSSERTKEFSIVKKDGAPVVIEVPCGEEIVKARIWARRFGKSAYLLLLDTNILGNSAENQIITDHLYDSNFQTHMKQELLLGIGGVRLLSKLGITPSIYHLNEGRTAFAAFELIVENIINNGDRNVEIALASIKERVVATKHTIFSVAGPSMSEKEFIALVGPYCKKNNISVSDIFKLGKNRNIKKIFSTTQFLLNCAQKQNGVSVLHTVFEKLAHPHSILFPITNGIYVKRWQADLWHESLKGETRLTDEAVWKIRRDLRERLVNFVAKKTKVTLDPDACTIVWARRFTRYKRPELLFSDLPRLKKICLNSAKVQFIISGQAHESDVEGKKIIEKIKAIVKDPTFNNKIVYLADYSITVAIELVSGADVWLNTPERGFEACGTSGMKSCLNGALQASTSDGWIDEVNWSDIGFILSGNDTAKAVYNALEKEIIPLFYTRGLIESDDFSRSGSETLQGRTTESERPEGLPLEWIRRIRDTQNIVKSGFTAKRMLHDYLTKAYLVL
ncbi:MAG: alpha-glucan family phosphorylase [bacterium]|nr:alpha-glucan family phosphorylase [bacterium]